MTRPTSRGSSTWSSTATRPPELLDTLRGGAAAGCGAAIDLSIELGKVICVPDPAEAAARDEAMAAAVTGEVSGGARPASVSSPVRSCLPTLRSRGSCSPQAQPRRPRALRRRPRRGWRLVTDRPASRSTSSRSSSTGSRSIGGAIVAVARRRTRRRDVTATGSPRTTCAGRCSDRLPRLRRRDAMPPARRSSSCLRRCPQPPVDKGDTPLMAASPTRSGRTHPTTPTSPTSSRSSSSTPARSRSTTSPSGDASTAGTAADPRADRVVVGIRSGAPAPRRALPGVRRRPPRAGTIDAARPVATRSTSSATTSSGSSTASSGDRRSSPGCRPAA